MNIAKPKSLKPERIQFYFLELMGWSLIMDWNPETRQDEPTGFWTAFELVDFREACELVAEMAASFLSTELGVPQGESLENHASYLSSWLSTWRKEKILSCPRLMQA